MGLFKSKDERRIEREMKIRQGMRSIEGRSASRRSSPRTSSRTPARPQIGDNGQYLFIRGALKKTAAVKKMLERQLLAIKNAMLIQQQAAASQQFAESMNLMAQRDRPDLRRDGPDQDAGRSGRRAVAQAGSMEERMEIFLDSMEQSRDRAAQRRRRREELVSDDEIDRMIQADVLAAEKAELGKLDELESEIAKELGATKQKD